MLRRFLTSVLMLALITAPAYAGGGGGGKEKEGIQYMELDPLLLPIIDDSGITQQVSLIVILEVPDPAKAEELKLKKPKIVDAYVEDLYGTLSKSNAVMANGILRLDIIKKRLKATTEKVVGADMVSDVLLQVVQQHRV